MADPTTTIDTADVLAVDDAIARATGAGSYGLTTSGFTPKPFARLLAEKLSLARALFGTDVDLASGSAIRKILEVSALEDARTWAALASIYDNMFVPTAQGEALSRLGDELGVTRPYLEASGTIALKLVGSLLPDQTSLTIPRGARLLTKGGHHAALAETVTLSPASSSRQAAVVAFYPGPENNLDPTKSNPDGTFPQKITLFNRDDAKLLGTEDDPGILSVAQGTGKKPEDIVVIEHTQPLTGGELQWADARYRDLLLRAPRSQWTVEGVRMAVSLVPGVRQVQVNDGWGGLDIDQPIFGYFDFLERVFGSDRDLVSPYYFDVLVAPTESAVWDGPDGLQAQVASAVEDLRPIGIFPNIKQADQIWIGIAAQLVVKGIPLPRGPKGTIVNDSPAAIDLKQRLLGRVQRYVDNLDFGDPVRASEITWALMNEPGMTDVQQLHLLRYPPAYTQVVTTQPPDVRQFQRYSLGQNVPVERNQIATFIDDYSQLVIV